MSSVETLSHVQQFSNIIYRIRFYTGLKSIKVKHEGQNGRCGNSLFWIGPMLGSWSTDTDKYIYEQIHLKLMNLSCFLFLTLKVSPKSKFKLLNFSPFWNFEYFPCHFTIWSNLIERNLLKFIFPIVSFIFTFPIVSLCLLFYHLVQNLIERNLLKFIFPICFFHIYLSHCFFLLTILPFGPNWLRENFLSNQHFPSLCPFLLHLQQKPFPLFTSILL